MKNDSPLALTLSVRPSSGQQISLDHLKGVFMNIGLFLDHLKEKHFALSLYNQVTPVALFYQTL